MKKLLFVAVLLNSISVIASESGLPDFDDVKKGLISSTFTIERNSEAGAAFGRATRLDWKKEGLKDDEASLLKAVQLGHAYAPGILFRDYNAEKPFYREILLATVLKKIKDKR